MKILRLDLLAFGAFSDTSLSLAQAQPALQLIHGRNEAGKSTALRAIRDLFFGVSIQTPDAFLHKKDLRIGALLADARGRELYVVRRKGTKNVLLDAHNQPLPGSDESWLTAGVSEQEFSSLFGLSHETLTSNAQELLSGQADLGQSLFGAGTGGRAVKDVLDELDGEAEAIFLRRGQRQKLNEVLNKLASARATLRQDELDAGTFADQERAVVEAELAETALRDKALTLRTEQSRLSRARAVLPLLSKRTELMRQRAELGALPLLASGARAARTQAQDTLRIESAKLAQLQGMLARWREQRAALHVPDHLPSIDVSVIDAVREQLVGYKRSKGELPLRRSALRDAQDALTQSLRRWGAELSVTDLEARTISAATERRIRQLAAAHETCVSELDKRRRVLARAEAELATQQNKLAQLRSAQAGQQSLLLELRVGLPDDAQLDRVEQGLSSLDAERGLLATRLRELEARAEQTTTALDALTRLGELPSEAELSELRAKRARLWAELTRMASEPTATMATLRPALLSELDQTITRGDMLADGLRHEAGRVAEHARLTAEHASIARLLQQHAQAQTRHEAQRREQDAQWQAVLRELGSAVRTPRELRAWLAELRAQHARVDQALASLDEQRAELAELQVQYERVLSDWATAMQSLSLPAAASGGQAEERLDAHAALQLQLGNVRKSERELAALQTELLELEAHVRMLVDKDVADASELAIEIMAARWVEAHERARTDQTRQRELDAQLASAQTDLVQTQLAIEQANRALSELMAAAGVAALDALQRIEDAVQLAGTLDAQLAETLRELAQASDGERLETLEAELDALTIDSVRARLIALEQDLESLADEQRTATHDVASRRNGLQRLRERSGAANAAAEVAEHLAAARGLAEHYLRLRLSAAVLRQEVARYRERHKGPILHEASLLFARLTTGEFSTLETDYAESDDAVLVCVRDNGERVPLAGLSTGTRDQLYLALRLASVKHLAARKELMPLVLDDVLVHFDDQRAAAALTVFAELAQTTQVLLFTHHERLVELARRVLPEQQLVTHELARGPRRSVA